MSLTDRSRQIIGFYELDVSTCRAVAEAYPLAAWDKGQYHGTSPSTKATCKQRMQEIRMDSIHAMEENGDRFSDLDDTAPTIGNLPVSPCREVGAKEGTRGLGPSSSIKVRYSSYYNGIYVS